MSNGSNFVRSDEHSLELTEISKRSKLDSDQEIDHKIACNLEELKKVQAIGNWIFVVEDETARSAGRVIINKKRYYQFKGYVISVGNHVTGVAPGDWVMWGLYSAQPVSIIEGVITWFLEGEKVLVKISKETKLSD